MTARDSIEPRPVIDLVERYVAQELRDADQYTNRRPLDESGIWSLHQLAREVYALGVRDGIVQEEERRRRQRQREHAAKEATP
ncbi:MULTISPECIES: hypothetical protein [Nocardia]|uniref:hypothetical protein n=1 Tax=Nocardia TaxID=1817 RepID=UPI0024548D19|nr:MULTISPECIES: hypothetical protein [Nocardia]